MDHMFYECLSLISLPDISKWNTHNVYEMNDIFSGYSSLIYLPDISKLNISNINNISSLFNDAHL